MERGFTTPWITRLSPGSAEPKLSDRRLRWMCPAAREGSVVEKVLRSTGTTERVRIGHPSGIMTMVPELKEENGELKLPSVGVQRTARRIMDGTLYIRK